ncbi:MAG: hypothetical protein OEO21_05115 [Candidatus Krumholzibacteria bacterium]|nr:hypothetical protein [Candidatus Krumholzibacteria bacterium]
MRLCHAAITAVMALALCVAAPRAQEHPQEHPSDKKATETVTIEMLSKAIANYVETDSKLKGGYFLVYDPVAESTLRLTLHKVHEDKLATLGDGVYFACADFKAPDGRLYDLDIFMKGDAGDLGASDVSIHKVEGKPRYGWAEEKGVWKKVAAK